jgi:hypothetical protein
MRSSRHAARLTIALALGAAFGLVTAPASSASCVSIPALQDAVKSADMVFVGTVIQTSNRGTWATVRVEEVWRGPDQPASVLIKGGPGGNAASSIDRTFEVGTKYLFFPYQDEAGGLADNSCTSTTPWGGELADLRPADARLFPVGPTPEAGGFDVMSVVVPAAIALLVAALLVGVGLLARGRDAS